MSTTHGRTCRHGSSSGFGAGNEISYRFWTTESRTRIALTQIAAIVPTPTVVAVGRSLQHNFSKHSEASIDLVEGLGVDQDCHNGVTVQHLSRMKIQPLPANLRQVHLIHAELFDEMREAGHTVQPQQLGENITTQNLDLLNLPTGTILRFGAQAVVEVTGLRNPCAQIENFQPGLQDKLVIRNTEGKLVRKCGIMSVVKTGGRVDVGSEIKVELPDEPHRPLRVV